MRNRMAFQFSAKSRQNFSMNQEKIIFASRNSSFIVK